MTPRRMRSEPDDVVASPVLRTRETHVDVERCGVATRMTRRDPPLAQQGVAVRTQEVGWTGRSGR
jgi:phosphohistidine phosphatase SixA